LGTGKMVFVAGAFSPDGKTLALAERGNAVSLRDVATGKETAKLTGHGGKGLDFLLGLAFTADGKSLVSAGPDRTRRAWDLATAKETAKLGVGPGVRAFFAPGATHVAVVSSDNGVAVWDVKEALKVRSLQGPPVRHGRSDTDGYLGAAFSPDGKTLAL